MTIYRVGDQGATVYARDGRPLVRLAPGMTVQPGVAETAAVPSLPSPPATRRRAVYDDKVIRPEREVPP